MKLVVTMIGGDVGVAVGYITLFVGMLGNDDDNVVVEEGMLGDNSNDNEVNNNALAIDAIEKVLLLLSLLLSFLLQDNSEPKEYLYYDLYQYEDSIFLDRQFCQILQAGKHFLGGRS